MSDLTATRDHCRKMAHRASDADRALWTQLADEIDAYLAGDLEQHALVGADDVPFDFGGAA